MKKSKLERFFIYLLISTVISFVLFYLLEEDRSCVFNWGTRCSNSYFFRAGFQSIFMTVLFIFLVKPKNIDKQ